MTQEQQTKDSRNSTKRSLAEWKNKTTLNPKIANQRTLNNFWPKPQNNKDSKDLAETLKHKTKTLQHFGRI